MFAEWEGWNYLDSVYFCVTSLAKIGFGDFVPGTSKQSVLELEVMEDTKIDFIISNIEQIKLVITFIYILLGMAIVSMCYYLLKEEVLMYMKRLQEAVQRKVQTFQETYMTSVVK